MSLNDQIAFRFASVDDHSFFYNSFLKSYRDSPMVRGVPNTIYFAKQHEIIEKLLSDPRCKSIVACNADDPSQIYGYILGQSLSLEDSLNLIVHWVYVKQPFRNCGIARALYEKFVSSLKFSSIMYTHRVKTVDRLLQSLPHMIFNPYLLLGV